MCFQLRKRSTGPLGSRASLLRTSMWPISIRRYQRESKVFFPFKFHFMTSLLNDIELSESWSLPGLSVWVHLNRKTQIRQLHALGMSRQVSRRGKQMSSPHALNRHSRSWLQQLLPMWLNPSFPKLLCFRLLTHDLSNAGVWVPSLIWELSFHMPCSQKPKR